MDLHIVIMYMIFNMQCVWLAIASTSTHTLTQTHTNAHTRSQTYLPEETQIYAQFPTVIPMCICTRIHTRTRAYMQTPNTPAALHVHISYLPPASIHIHINLQARGRGCPEQV